MIRTSFIALAISLFTATNLPAEESQITPFTGKVTKGKVRMRSSPSLDGPIINEMAKNDLVIVVGENEEFYAVQAPADIKGYVFRKFIIDNKIEGNNVNVRRFPNTEAPIIAQMNNGDSVDGVIVDKWLEIAPPSSTRFYIAKEFVEKVGDEQFMARVAKRRDEVNRLLQSNYTMSQQELQKPFSDIKIDRIIANYELISKDYSDFPEQAARSKELLEELRDNYLHKKIAYLEGIAANRQQMGTIALAKPENDPIVRNTYWSPVENGLYEDWNKQHVGTIDDFYREQIDHAQSLTGIVSPYNPSVKNRPGDYVLINKITNLPIAFIYSTRVNMNDYVGKEVTVRGSERPNNHFAHPAYFVLFVEG